MKRRESRWHGACFSDFMQQNRRALASLQLWTALVFGTIVLSACGGSARVDGLHGSAAGAENSAGAAGQASAAGAPGLAGASSVGGSVGVAGASAAGGGGDLDCAKVTCVLNCSQDEFVQTVPGSCCPRCGTQPPECLKGRAGFSQLLGSLLQHDGATSCSSDYDCAVLPSFPKCGHVCPGTPVSAASATELTTELNQWETANCSTCAPTTVPCPAPPHPVCVDGTCLSYHPL